ncbi:MAG: hypothetical protein Q8S31_00825 [Alphaproteobacteria bacterium]|nr:hypothetical protein [Alphaproteobacteria bacterium]
MKFINVLFLSLFFYTKSYAVKGLENVFTPNIYDQSELPLSATNTEKTELLKTKKQKMLDEKIINAKTIEIKTLQKLLDEMNQKRDIATYFVYPTSYLLASIPYIFTAKFFLSSPYAASYSLSQSCSETAKEFAQYMMGVITQPDMINRFYKDCVAYCEKRIRDLRNELIFPTRRALRMLEQVAPIRNIEHQLSLESSHVHSVKHLSTSGKIFNLECLYVCNKSTIPANWQDKIESTFMSYYNQDLFQDEKFLQSMITHPTKTKVFSKEFDDTYFEALEEITNNLKAQMNLSESIQEDCEQILTSIANCAQVTCDLYNQETTRSFSYCFLDSIDNIGFQESSILIANMIGLPYCIVDAKNEVLNDALLFGAYKSKKGLFLEALQAGHYLNSILIIKNIDHWVKNITNLPWLLKLFDTEAKTFDSNYLGFKVDWSKLSIICSGETPIDQLDNAFQSRVTPYSF